MVGEGLYRSKGNEDVHSICEGMIRAETSEGLDGSLTVTDVSKRGHIGLSNHVLDLSRKIN